MKNFVLGFLATVVAMLITIFVRNLLLAFPFAWPQTTWHTGIGFVGVIVIAALAIHGLEWLERRLFPPEIRGS